MGMYTSARGFQMKKCAKCDFEYDDAYDACPQCARQIPVSPPAAAKRPLWPWIVGAIVVLAILGMVGIGALGLIAVPVFSSASASAQQKSCFANQRTITGAEAVAVQQGAAPSSDWNGLMSVLVPTYLKAAPTCPGGGTYTFTADKGVTCSVHGSVNDQTTTP
jgi:hypothetical protein